MYLFVNYHTVHLLHHQHCHILFDNMEEYIKKKNIYMSNSNKIINELYNNLIYDEYSENILSKKGVKEKDHIEYYEEQQ